MRTIKAFIESHPVLSYFALVFAISWGGFLLVGGPGLFAGTNRQTICAGGPTSLPGSLPCASSLVAPQVDTQGLASA